MLSVWKWVVVWSEGELLLIVIFLEYKQSPLWTLLSIYTLPSFVHSLGLVIHTFFQRVCLNSGVVCTHIFTYESRFYSLYKRFLRNWWSLGNIDVSQWLILFSKIVLVFLWNPFLCKIVNLHTSKHIYERHEASYQISKLNLLRLWMKVKARRKIR